MLSVELLEDLKNGLGGHDAASIFGANKNGSPLSVFMSKREEKTQELDNDYIIFGNLHERTIAYEFSRRNNIKVRKNNRTIRHKEYPFLIGHIDRDIVGENAFLEMKTAHEYKKDEWDDGKVPLHYLIQCMHYIMIGDYDYCYIACLIGGNKYIQRRIDRDQKTIDELLDCLLDFWYNYHLKNIMPGPSFNDDLSLYLKNTIDIPIKIDINVNEFIDLLNSLKEEIKQKDMQAEILKKKIQQILGDNISGFTDKYNIFWSNRKSTSYNSEQMKIDGVFEKYAKVNESKVFYIKERKENNGK